MAGKNKLTTFEEDILKEIANIGAGNAATSLSSLLKYGVTISTSMIKIIKVSKLPEIIGPKEVPAVGSYTKLVGDLQGIGLVYMLQENALSFADLMAGRRLGTKKVLTEEDRSGLNEMGLILTSSYSNALSLLSGLTILPSLPRLFFARIEQIASLIKEELSKFKENDPLICVKTQLMQKEHKLGAFILFFFELSSWDKLIQLMEERTK
jgi:chemotaxis protein CheC